MAMNRMEFRASAKILEDPNLFIGDTGASSDTTFSDLGFKNKRSSGEEDDVTDASGNGIRGESVGDVSGIFCDKFGEEQGRAKIQEMVYSSDAEFNLFSITKRLIDGWELSGNNEALWITKGNNKGKENY